MKLKKNVVRKVSVILFIAGIVAVSVLAGRLAEHASSYLRTESLEKEAANLERVLEKREEHLSLVENEIRDRLYLLAKIIHTEQGSQRPEDLPSKIAVGHVVLNRVRSPLFPNTIEEVIFQPNQFSPTFDGSWERKEPMEMDFKAAIAAIRGERVYSEEGVLLNDALFFMNPRISGRNNVRWFRRALSFVGTLGGHEFFVPRVH